MYIMETDKAKTRRDGYTAALISQISATSTSALPAGIAPWRSSSFLEKRTGCRGFIGPVPPLDDAPAVGMNLFVLV